MKKILLLALIYQIAISSIAQQNLVQVVASGDGKTKDESLNAALRHCIEKTFGVFVSTNTTIVNDSLVQDNIANIASGNIASYYIISEISNNEIFTTTVSAQISPENIVKAMKSKGYTFEMFGNLYAQNIDKEKFYKKQESIAIENFCNTWSNIQLFDFEIKIGEPINTRFAKQPTGRRDNLITYWPTAPDLLLSLNKDFNKIINEQKRVILNNYRKSYNIYGPDKMINEKIVIDQSSMRFINTKSFFGDIIIENTQEENINNDYYFIPVLFIPKININYINYVKSFIALLSSLSIKEQLSTYEQINGKAHEYIIQIPEDLKKTDLNKSKYLKLYTRNNLSSILQNNYIKLRDKDLNFVDFFLLKATAFNFIEENLKSLTNPPLVYISETQNKVNGENSLTFSNYPSSGFAYGFDPSILLIKLTLNELKEFKKIDFKIKK